jgi:hypothetical protein
MCSDFPLSCLLEGKSKFIFIYAIQANPGVELQVYSLVAFEGDGVNGQLHVPVAFHLGKNPRYESEWLPLGRFGRYGERINLVPMRRIRLRFLRDLTLL